MQEENTFAAAIEIMRRHTGIVIPVYFPQEVDNDLGRALLEDNVQAYLTQVDDPQVICLSVDGAAYGKDIATAIAARHGVQVICAAHNKGSANMNAEIKDGRLVITIPLHDPRPSASGKTLVVASSGGNQATAAVVNGKPITIGVNAYIAR